MRTRWYDALPPASLDLLCGDARHRVHWRRGKLLLENHDLDAERALGALGAEMCDCMDLVGAWSAQDLARAEVVHSLVRGSAQHGPILWSLSVPGLDRMRRSAKDMQRLRVRIPPEAWDAMVFSQQRLYRRTLLRTLPGDLGQRHIAGAIVAWDRRWTEVPPDDRITLHAVLGRRVRRAVVASIASWHRVDFRRPPEVAVTVSGSESVSTISGHATHDGAGVTASVPLSWLVTVWARGLAVVDGCAVLAAGTMDDGVIAARAVRWERVQSLASEPVVAPARLWREDGGTWHLRWR